MTVSAPPAGAQLVAVLPPLSAPALPKPLADLFDTEDPELAKFFPRDVQFDLNGAREAYKAVVLLPFIDAPTLRAACAERLPLITSEERGRNRFGPTYVYVPAQDAIAREIWQLADENKQLDGYAMAQVHTSVTVV